MHLSLGLHPSHNPSELVQWVAAFNTSLALFQNQYGPLGRLRLRCTGPNSSSEGIPEPAVLYEVIQRQATELGLRARQDPIGIRFEVSNPETFQGAIYGLTAEIERHTGRCSHQELVEQLNSFLRPIEEALLNVQSPIEFLSSPHFTLLMELSSDTAAYHEFSHDLLSLMEALASPGPSQLEIVDVFITYHKDLRRRFEHLKKPHFRAEDLRELKSRFDTWAAQAYEFSSSPSFLIWVNSKQREFMEGLQVHLREHEKLPEATVAAAQLEVRNTLMAARAILEELRGH